jgi:hypothetical protein
MSCTTAHGRLRYNTHAIVAAHACVSAKVDSRYPVIDSVLIVSRAESADAMRGSESRGLIRLRLGEAGMRQPAVPPPGGTVGDVTGQDKEGHDDRTAPGDRLELQP